MIFRKIRTKLALSPRTFRSVIIVLALTLLAEVAGLMPFGAWFGAIAWTLFFMALLLAPIPTSRAGSTRRAMQSAPPETAA